MLREGKVIAYPTDSAYALGCLLGDKSAQEHIQQIRHLDKNHNFTLICRNLSDLGSFAQVSNPVFRLLKAHTPGPYTFILSATHEVPRRLQHPKRKTIGLRVPGHPVVRALLEELGEPLLSSSLILPGHDFPLSDPQEISEALSGDVVLVDGGACGIEPTTVVDLVSGKPTLLRIGKGDPAPFQALF